uniref:Putative precatalytic spliceosome n=1 Tax=Corethrella appendiculata TaxID=1370023 RepID=U5EYC2_9DIPT
MADYWKSNEKKYCDFCKCWIANNKPSIQFHENGRRHQINVQKRLSEISRQSAKNAKIQQSVDEDMKRMNDGAMKAYLQDISSGTGDLTTRAISEQVKLRGPAVDPLMPIGGWPSNDEDDNYHSKKLKVEVTATAPTEEPVKEASMWCEAKSEDGHTYYWNVKTGESVWEEPKEGYMTLKEYEKLNQTVVQKQEQEEFKNYRYNIDNAEEIAAALKREKLREKYSDRISKLNNKYEKEDDEAGSSKNDEPSFSYSAGKPYGEWQTVVHKQAKQVDLQLPKQQEPLYVAKVTNEPEKIDRKFKEKVIDSIPADVSSSLNEVFVKKRKFSGRNARQRTNDD